MSAEDDNPLTRWSRRKRAARKGAPAASEPAPNAAVGTEPGMRATPARRQPAETNAAVEDKPEPPPSLEDLTPESDLTAFLRKDVPEGLKRAALRKMWSLDAAIREHVGLAENSWDFNRPESIPGFGSIAASDTLPDFFSTPEPGTPSGVEAPVASVRAPEIARAEMRNEREAPRATAAPPVEESATSRSPSGADVGGDGSSDVAKPVVASRHGGALPRG